MADSFERGLILVLNGLAYASQQEAHQLAASCAGVGYAGLGPLAGLVSSVMDRLSRSASRCFRASSAAAAILGSNPLADILRAVAGPRRGAVLGPRCLQWRRGEPGVPAHSCCLSARCCLLVLRIFKSSSALLPIFRLGYPKVARRDRFAPMAALKREIVRLLRYSSLLGLLSRAPANVSPSQSKS